MEKCTQLINVSDMNDVKKIFKLFIHIAEAINWLSSYDIYHGDIKPENILYTIGDRFVLCDFGTSVTGKTNNKVGTP